MESQLYGDDVITVKPFLKWAGGKRWLIANHGDLFPQDYNRYIEPFLGSGSVFFGMQPSTSILSDINNELIGTYITLRDDWVELRRLLESYHLHHSKEFYYNIRASRPTTSIERAARFIYLNRTCWNGLYRVNKSGHFNVPIGTKSSVILPDDNFEAVSRLLSRAELLSCDFEMIIDKACEGDFLFVDPPYTVRHNYNGFVKYNETLFSWEDQLRLADALIRAKARNVKILSTNAFHESIRSLYSDHFMLTCVDRVSPIAADKASRKRYEEYVISNLGEY
ncbi:DNA adenine methylase [Deinococcus pimensis]|uniref:DNA adenine methylase n=1 Tax=Deinococcus pimensis TaxID=309888 RepID=UPI0004ACCBDD|nr:Dam family site-specific DNA-(adenine-N6)-methyltransferase [Deinococcus pimensis]